MVNLCIQILTARIREALPIIRDELHNAKTKFEEILETFGERVEELPDRRKAVLDLMYAYCFVCFATLMFSSDFDAVFQATIKDGAENVDEKEL